MIRTLLPFFFSLALAGVAHAAPAWQPIAADCAEQMHASGQCGLSPNCNVQWPQVTACVAERALTNVTKPNFQTCIAVVDSMDHAKPLGYDRVAHAVSCLLSSGASINAE